MFPLHLRARQGPGLVIGLHLHVLEGNWLHHLPDGAIRQDHGGHKVLVRQIEPLDGEARHFLHRGRSQHDHAVITMSAALGSLEVVGLTGLDAAQTGAAPLHVHHKSGHVGTGYVAQTFTFQRNTGAGGGGHNPEACRRRAVNHINGSDLALRLKEHAALNFRQALCHIGGDLRLGGDRIAEVVAAARPDSGLRDGFVALH